MWGDIGLRVFRIITIASFKQNLFEEDTSLSDNVYDNLENPDYFVYEIWYMMSKLTIYSFDIGEDPRFALETLINIAFFFRILILSNSSVF